MKNKIQVGILVFITLYKLGRKRSKLEIQEIEVKVWSLALIYIPWSKPITTKISVNQKDFCSLAGTLLISGIIQYEIIPELKNNWNRLLKLIITGLTCMRPYPRRVIYHFSALTSFTSYFLIKHNFNLELIKCIWVMVHSCL